MPLGAAIREILTASFGLDFRTAPNTADLPDRHPAGPFRVLAANLELAFGITVSEDDLAHLHTIRDVVQCVRLRVWERRVEGRLATASARPGDADRDHDARAHPDRDSSSNYDARAHPDRDGPSSSDRDSHPSGDRDATSPAPLPRVDPATRHRVSRPVFVTASRDPHERLIRYTAPLPASPRAHAARRSPKQR
jgi:hypothetical protein